MKHKLTIILVFISLLCFAQETKVVRVIDGDTFEIESGERVRMIGINTPEISDIFGREAKQHLSDLILGKFVDLQKDNISKNRDRYQRLLRYVFLDGVDINNKMIFDGYAFAYLKYHFSKKQSYKSSQMIAQKRNIGMWGDEKNNNDIQQESTKVVENIGFSNKAYFIIGSLIILIFIGLYYYVKK